MEISGFKKSIMVSIFLLGPKGLTGAAEGPKVL